MMVQSKQSISQTLEKVESWDYPYLITFAQDGRGILIDPMVGNSIFISANEAEGLISQKRGLAFSSSSKPFQPTEVFVEIKLPLNFPIFTVNKKKCRARTRSSLVDPNDLICSWAPPEVSSNDIQQHKLARLSWSVAAGSYVSRCMKTTSAVVDAYLKADLDSDVFQARELCSAMPNLRISKDMLRYAKVRGIFQNSFLVCEIEKDLTGDINFLIVDQHALHERIRLENLETEYLESPECLKSTAITPYVRIPLPEVVVAQCLEMKNDLVRYGLIIVETDVSDKSCILLSRVPTLMLDKNRMNMSRDGLREDLGTCILELTQIFKNTSRTAFILPTVITSWLASVACKGAIKFGDAVPLQELEMLFPAAAKCAFPFQCAHGRPSMVPVCLQSKLDFKMACSPNLVENGK